VGAADVLLADNGVVSLNLPLNEQALGSKASRSTHPTVLRLMNELMKKLWAAPPLIRNPLAERTRSEVLGVLRASGVPELLTSTNSCAATNRRPNERAHCGTCSQCVDRRFAALAAGMAEFDPVATTYAVDIFRDELEEGRSRIMAESYYDLALRIDGLPSDEAVLDTMVELHDALDAAAPHLDQQAMGFASMLRRQAAGVVAVMKAEVEKAAAEIAGRQLPNHCLIRLVAAPGNGLARPNELSILLSDAEEEAFMQQGFLTRFPVVLTGAVRKRALNIVRVAGNDVPVETADFLLFLQLVLALKGKSEGGGWLAHKATRFWRHGNPPISGEDTQRVQHSLSRLRKSFAGRVEGLDPYAFLEQKHVRTRLSTHPRYVDGSWHLLLHHGHSGVITLAAEIREALSDRSRRPAA
jgi:hypothetical protein